MRNPPEVFAGMTACGKMEFLWDSPFPVHHAKQTADLSHWYGGSKPYGTKVLRLPR